MYIVFDSDVIIKPQVHKALSRLKDFLESRGAEVRIVYLPHGEGGKKQGVDDYFVAGHGVDDLLSHATTELREQHVEEDEDPPHPNPTSIKAMELTKDLMNPEFFASGHKSSKLREAYNIAKSARFEHGESP